MLLCVVAPVSAGELVPFVIPARVHPKSLIAFPDGPAIQPDGPRVVVRGGHFFREGRRVRIWGVNLCFGACFPSRADAPHVARRLAAAGINSVRFHHMDMSGFPRGIWDPSDPMKLSRKALDRLDFFIDQLARRGIFANINLHVSRTHSRYLKLPDGRKLRRYDKIADLFTPALIDAQKRYARDLLTRVNPYRKARYADDAAVAFVEINNEDSFFMWGADNTLRSLPPHYSGILCTRYAEWLKGRYGSTARLREAWAKGAQPLGKDLTVDPTFRTIGAGSKAAWRLIGHSGCAASAEGTPAGLRVRIDKADDTGWHIQLMQKGLKVKAGGYYTLTFRARASKPRKISFNVMQAQGPWKMLGLNRVVEIAGEWRTFREGFIATADENNARVTFQLGGSNVPVEIADVRLRPGGKDGLGDGESIESGNVAVFAESETDARTLDRWRFLAETEKAYFDGMKAYVRKDLGCKALVTGTIVFGPLGLYGQSDMDYIDGHAYWQHPRFPGRAWDRGNWTIEQKAMVDHPDQSTLFRLAAQRLEGKPYTVSEYNHPAPNDFQAECVPMIASYAASQDWDGVWLFTYCQAADDWDRRAFRGYFDIDHNPAKWGFVPAGTVIFREGGIKPRSKIRTVSLTGSGDLLGDLARMQQRHGGDMRTPVGRSLGTGSRLEWVPLRIRVGLGASASASSPAIGSRSRLSWVRHDEDNVWFIATGPQAAVEVARWQIIEGVPWRVMTTTALDSRSLETSRKILITCCTRSQNTGMRFSKDRRTVGRQWGTAPVRIQTVQERFLLPGDWDPRWRCHALRPDGSRGDEVPLDGKGDQWFDMSPKYKTMWYLLTRE
jgi:hypothetical protein